MIGSMFRKAWYSDSATLNLDFTTGVLDSRLTFTRAANTATVINSSGLVQTVNADVPRFDHDPTTLAPRGLLIEGSAVNLATNSNLQAGWLGGTNRTVTPNTTDVLSPDGTNNAAKVALTSASYCSVYEAIVGLANATTYTFSYWIRGTAGNQQRIYSLTQGADLVTQTTLTYTNTGWTRIQVTFTSGAANNTVFIYPVSRPTGTVNDVLYIWGAQLEAGSGASSYIPTTNSSATRNADECSMTGSNFSDWFTNSAEGSFYVAYNMNYPDAFLGTTVPRRAIDLSDAGGTNRLYGNAAYQVTPPANAGRLVRVFDSGTVDLNSAGTLVATAAQNTRWAMGYKTNDNHLAWVGGSASDNSGTLATGFTTMFIGAQRNFTGAFLNGTIRTIKYWPTRLPDATLQSLTT